MFVVLTFFSLCYSHSLPLLQHMPFCVLCDSGTYFSTAFAVSTAHEAKNPAFIALSHVAFVGTLPLHGNTVLPALCLVVCKHCLWFHLCAFVVFYGWWFDCSFLALDLMGVVRSTTVLFLGLSRLGVCLLVLDMVVCSPSKCCTSSDVNIVMQFATANLLILNSELFCNPVTMSTVLAGSCT